MNKYSNPAMQAIADQAYSNVQRAAHIMTAMQKGVSMLRRVDDKPVEVTAAQKAVIAKNQGKHIYSPSHPLYKESE